MCPSIALYANTKQAGLHVDIHGVVFFSVSVEEACCVEPTRKDGRLWCQVFFVHRIAGNYLKGVKRCCLLGTFWALLAESAALLQFIQQKKKHIFIAVA